MINISNYPGNDNPPRPRPPTVALVRERPGSRVRDTLVLAMSVALDWLAYLLRRWGDRWFSMNDTEACWRGWQITKTHAGLGRRYRDIRYDTWTYSRPSDRVDPGEPAWAGGLGHHGPFG